LRIKPQIPINLIVVKFAVDEIIEQLIAFTNVQMVISIINLDFIKTMQHNKFVYQNRTCRTANSTPLNIIGHKG
jgi:hypothetical protein